MKGTVDTSIQVGAWKVDPAREQISLNGTTIKLERRLMQLLLCLAERPGQILSIGELLDTVWAGVVVTPDSVYHSVASLRRILGDDKKTPTYITNTPRRGYSLIAPVAAWQEAMPVAGVLLKKQRASMSSAAAARLPWRLVGLATVVFLMATLIYLSVAQRRNPSSADIVGESTKPSTDRPTAPYPSRSIAVLPFEDLSERKNQQYFADGMAEEIFDRLVQIPDLWVPGRTSSFYLRDKRAPLAEIADTLRVANVLEGSVRTSGTRIRVAARLVRTDDGYQVWSHDYDRQLSDVFAVQDEISSAITAALQISLSGIPANAQQGGTESIDAYQRYLKARAYAYMDNGAAPIKKSQKLLHEAITIDPHFGLAWTLLATTTVALVDRGDLAPAPGYEEAHRLAEHAIAISPGIAQAHAVIGYLYRTQDWNWVASRKELQLALRADPTDAVVLMMDGLLFKTLGEHAEAERQMRAAVSRDPLLNYADFHLANTLYLAAKFKESEAVFRRLLNFSPSFWCRPYLAKALLAQGRNSEALAEIEQADAAVKMDLLPIVLFANDRMADGRAALEALIAARSASDAFYIAMTYAFLNDRERSLQWLERAYTQRDPGLLDMMGEPLLSNITSDVKYHSILHAMDLAE